MRINIIKSLILIFLKLSEPLIFKKVLNLVKNRLFNLRSQIYAKINVIIIIEEITTYLWRVSKITKKNKISMLDIFLFSIKKKIDIVDKEINNVLKARG